MVINVHLVYKTIIHYINLPYSVSCFLNVSFIISTILDCLPAFQVKIRKKFDNQQEVLF